MSVYKYGTFQQAGELRRQWLDNSNDQSCLIKKSQLTLIDIQARYNIEGPINDGHQVSIIITDQLPLLGLHIEREIETAKSVYSSWSIANDEIFWSGAMGEGMISVDNIERTKGSNAPSISEVTLALFNALFNIEDLKYIFVTDVLNEETLQFIRKKLYSNVNNIQWPEGKQDGQTELGQPQTWEHGTAEFDAILGTRIGKLVAYIVLGGFPRGTVRIARIITWPSLDLRSQYTGTPANMRFDVERV
ncbi:uncharacterized protein N7469_000295 [Penicillium citrinum]|uniref:Uncharacterized protein n=1 Tax=Penicillium citrinum TaxID=5077 RepID=A0A9W9PCP6_PENCI|nr:uncharacterized protein N7469_000295 [Penicillium citrinum]KAJ5241968.1 hypothetical protein N7469_000295 [Penicillium citrinum]KAK5807320.1 hypothetical protein VI817_001578 [Penicillium citrinum]